jgi:hypothetical protein
LSKVKGLTPLAVIDEVLVLARVPVFLGLSRYPGTEVVKEIKIDVFMRSVQPEEVAELYRQKLAREEVSYEKSNGGSFSWEFSDA